jgi:hypothetical protein
MFQFGDSIILDYLRKECERKDVILEQQHEDLKQLKRELIELRKQKKVLDRIIATLKK